MDDREFYVSCVDQAIRCGGNSIEEIRKNADEFFHSFRNLVPEAPPKEPDPIGSNIPVGRYVRVVFKSGTIRAQAILETGIWLQAGDLAEYPIGTELYWEELDDDK